MLFKQVDKITGLVLYALIIASIFLSGFQGTIVTAQKVGRVLVSNIGQPNDGAVELSKDHAQRFTTGSTESALYRLKFDVDTAVADSTTDTLTVTLQGASGGVPDSTILATFNADHNTIESTGEKTVYLASPYALVANTDYFIVFDYDDNTNGGNGRLTLVTSDAEDGNSQTGWSIGNAAHESSDNGGSWSTHSSSKSLKIALETEVEPLAVDLIDASDSGANNSDNITNDNTPTLSVSGFPASAAITVTAEHAAESSVEAVIPAASNTDTGDDEVTFSTLADGTWSITATDDTYTTRALTVVIDTDEPVLSIDDVVSNNTNNRRKDNAVDIIGTGSFDLETVTLSVTDSRSATFTPAAVLTVAAENMILGGATNITLSNNDYFGSAVAVDNNRTVVGAAVKNAVYILEDKNNDGSYSNTDEKIKIDSSTLGITMGNFDYFGHAVAVDGNRLIVGAPNNNAVYILEDKNGDGRYDDTAAKESIKIGNNTAGITLEVNDFFGSAVAVDGNRLIVGAAETQFRTGAIYILEDKDSDGAYDGAGENIKIGSDTPGITLSIGDNFGAAIAADGNRLIIGAPTSPAGNRYGAVHILEDKNGDGSYTDILTNESIKINGDSIDTSVLPGHRFGQSVAVDGNRLIVGAIGDDDGGNDKGAVYILEDRNNDDDYEDDNENVKISHNTRGITLKDSDHFGSAIAVAGDRFIIGARGTDGNKGAVHDIVLQKTFTAHISAQNLAKGTVTVTADGTDIAGNTATKTNRFKYFIKRRGSNIHHLGKIKNPSKHLADFFLPPAHHSSPYQQPHYFSKNLSPGDVGEDVRKKQIFLNNNYHHIAITGPGSPGNETGYYGPLTQQAVTRYQQKHNIEPANGHFNTKTREHINSTQGFAAATGTQKQQ